jgi:hypothetical protein
MYIVELRTACDDSVGIFLKEVRRWLDDHRFQPSTFAYFDLNPGMSIQVSFRVGEEAEVFARRFRGSLKRRPSGAQVPSAKVADG